MFDAQRRGELDAAIELIHFSYRELVGQPDRALSARGFGRAHHRILYFIAKLGAPSVGELLQALGISKQALAGPLRELYAQRLVRYECGKADARVKHLVLTDAGKRMETRLAAQQRRVVAASFAAAGEAAEAGWREVMHHLAASAMRRAGRRPPPPSTAGGA